MAGAWRSMVLPGKHRSAAELPTVPRDLLGGGRQRSTEGDAVVGPRPFVNRSQRSPFSVCYTRTDLGVPLLRQPHRGHQHHLCREAFLSHPLKQNASLFNLDPGPREVPAAPPARGAHGDYREAGRPAGAGPERCGERAAGREPAGGSVSQPAGAPQDGRRGQGGHSP